MIFQNKETIIKHLCWKAKSLTLETISTKNLKKIDVVGLCVEERDFIGYLLDTSNSNQIVSNSSIHSNIPNHSWKIRNKKEFSSWLRGSNLHYLFFDGASKSNSGTTGAGGVIHNTNSRIISTYEWGLGSLSNNRAEALALYQGLNQLQKFGIRKALIFGYFATIISLMVCNQKASDIFLEQMINRCQALTRKNMELRLFHVLCSLNKEADICCCKPKSNLLCNNTKSHHHIP